MLLRHVKKNTKHENQTKTVLQTPKTKKQQKGYNMSDVRASRTVPVCASPISRRASSCLVDILADINKISCQKYISQVWALQTTNKGGGTRCVILDTLPA
jgi:hypothetical protein